MTLEGDIYVRYQTIDPAQNRNTEPEKWKNDLPGYLRYKLLSKMPIKIDIGAIYSDSPVVKSSRHRLHEIKGSSVIPKEKEICFDIDMTDYDPVRICCSGADICPKCWPLMQIAAEILKSCLGKAFGLKQLLFVYSGRRGIHCWVCDPKAREWSPVVRSALAEYIQILSGASGPGEHGAAESRRARVFRQHPEIIDDSCVIIDKYWEEYAVTQGLFDADNFTKITGLVRNEETRNTINLTLQKMADADSRAIKFRDLLTKQKLGGADNFKEIQLQFCYPRLDINVSKDLHHLLKSPFSIHPKTDRVCVPFDDIQNFDPFVVPTCTQICDEYNKGDKDRFGFDRCESFRGYVKTFETFLKSCLKDELEFNMKAGVADVKDEVKVKRQKMAGLEEVQDKENVKMEI